MKSAQFTNFSTEPFTGYWDGKGKTFKPGQSMYMGDYLAKHFAKHLTNRELLKLGKERSTSPKRPDDVPEFMELFSKAYQAEEEEIEMTDGRDSLDVEIDMANRNRDTQKGVQMIDVPDDGEDEESEFPSIPEAAPVAAPQAAPTEQEVAPAPRRGRPPAIKS